jgi:hypothetical protein
MAAEQPFERIEVSREVHLCAGVQAEASRESRELRSMYGEIP